MNVIKSRMCRLHTFPFVLLCLSFFSTSLRAAVVLSASDTFMGDNTNRAVHTETFNLVNSSDTVLIAVVTGHDAPDFTFSAVYDAGGADTSMTQLALATLVDGSNNAFSAVFGIELGSVSAGSVDLTWEADTGNTRGTMSVFQLSNATLTGFSSATSNTNTPGTGEISTTLNGLAAGSFVLSATGADNNSVSYNNTASAGLSGTPAPTFTDWADEGAYVNTLIYNADASGTVTHAADPSNASARQAMASVGIATIPEPSSLILMSLSVLSALLIRKRF